MKLSLHNITKRFGDTRVVNDVSLDIRDGELFLLLGPSGCGKTTLLRLLAGFYQPDAGEIRFDTRLVNIVPPNKRNTGMVFQSYALWPHMTVAENVAYGLDVRDIRAEEKRARVMEVLRVVQMEPYAARTPNQLSGGQQQRVAVARALVIKPDVLLLDEPLSNLDAKLRLEMREEIRRIHAETGLTTVYVTHDQEEALSLADRIAVMRAGVVEQLGAPREVYREPRNKFVAGFMGEANFIEGTVQSIGADGVLKVATSTGELCGTAKGQAFEVGQRVTCLIRPESLNTRGDAAINRFEMVVRSATYLGKVEQYVLALPDGAVWKGIEQNPEAVRKPGERLTVQVDPQDVILLKD